MPKGRLTQRRVDALKRREETLDVCDSLVRDFGVRIPTSGRKCFFLHRQIDEGRVRQSTGDARAMALMRAANGRHDTDR